jgi:hypothetical protein
MCWGLCICWRRCVLEPSQDLAGEMSKIIDKRVTAQLEGDFVVFLIGVKINAW